MSRLKIRKCPHCKEFFKPDVRNKKRQRFCSKPECRKASKKAAQARWFSKPENQEYFRGQDQVTRVQEWRKNNPGYWKFKIKRNALQDDSITQVVEVKEKSSRFVPSPLQDVSRIQVPVLIGLIAKLTGTTLQDDIASTTILLQQLGSDVLNGVAKCTLSQEPYQNSLVG